MDTNKIYDFQVTIRKVKFEDKASGFIIAHVQADPAQGFLSEVIKGHFPGITIRPGVVLRIQATLSKHKTYGNSWQVFKSDIPDSEGRLELVQALTAYLSEISPFLLQRVLAKLPDVEGLWGVFQKDPKALFEKYGLNDPDASRILAEWADYESVRTSIAGLREAGIADKMIMRVQETLGEDAADLIAKNPYVLLSVEGMSFNAVDKFACEIHKISQSSALRLRELAYYMYMRVLKSGGHVFFPASKLTHEIKAGFDKENLYYEGFDEQTLRSMVTHWAIDGRVVVDETDNVYTAKGYLAEHEIHSILGQMQGVFNVSLDIDSLLTSYEARYKIELSDLQKEAVKQTATNRVFLLTGLPGTGKSTVMRAVAYVLKTLNRQMTLLAPTGIAAQRLNHTTGMDASTIHRFLRYQGEDVWGYNAASKVSAETIILDEMSMVGMNTFYRLLDAIPPDTQLILVGDPAQLPSVEEGNVLHDLIDSGVIPRVHLTQIFRQESDSSIVTASHAIHQGLCPDLSQPKSDFAFSHHDNAQDAQDRIVKLATGIFFKNQLGGKISYQVIAPKYAGTLGVDEINNKIREKINPPDSSKTERQFGLVDLREGDRVICLQNNPQLGVYNGEIGKVEVIDMAPKEVLVKFFGYTSAQDKMVVFPFAMVSHMLKHAFAITTHRSQGQEWDVVIMALAREHHMMLQRQLLYTAVTRARKKVILVGEWQAVSKAVRTENVTKRYTLLAYRLRGRIGLTPELE